jgi:hypothetical protein
VDWAGIQRLALRHRWVLGALAIAGALICAGQVVLWSSMGAWPFHDTICYWITGVRIREGVEVYGRATDFLTFRYAPPWAVLSVPLSFLPPGVPTVAIFFGNVLALRYICGSWRNAGLVAWLPFVPRALVTGNVDLMMAAAMWATLTNVRRSGWALAFFALAKVSPAALLLTANRERRWEFVIAIAGLCAITLPVLHLWPEWWSYLFGYTPVPWIPLALRIPIGLALLALRRPWAVAAGAAILTPAFYFHSMVLLIPAARLALRAVRERVADLRVVAAVPLPKAA